MSTTMSNCTCLFATPLGAITCLIFAANCNDRNGKREMFQPAGYGSCVVHKNVPIATFMDVLAVCSSNKFPVGSTGSRDEQKVCTVCNLFAKCDEDKELMGKYQTKVSESIMPLHTNIDNQRKETSNDQLSDYLREAWRLLCLSFSESTTETSLNEFSFEAEREAVYLDFRRLYHRHFTSNFFVTEDQRLLGERQDIFSDMVKRIWKSCSAVESYVVLTIPSLERRYRYPETTAPLLITDQRKDRESWVMMNGSDLTLDIVGGHVLLLHCRTTETLFMFEKRPFALTLKGSSCLLQIDLTVMSDNTLLVVVSSMDMKSNCAYVFVPLIFDVSSALKKNDHFLLFASPVDCTDVSRESLCPLSTACLLQTLIDGKFDPITLKQLHLSTDGCSTCGDSNFKDGTSRSLACTKNQSYEDKTDLLNSTVRLLIVLQEDSENQDLLVETLSQRFLIKCLFVGGKTSLKYRRNSGLAEVLLEIPIVFITFGQEWQAITDVGDFPLVMNTAIAFEEFSNNLPFVVAGCLHVKDVRTFLLHNLKCPGVEISCKMTELACWLSRITTDRTNSVVGSSSDLPKTSDRIVIDTVHMATSLFLLKCLTKPECTVLEHVFEPGFITNGESGNLSMAIGDDHYCFFMIIINARVFLVFFTECFEPLCWFLTHCSFERSLLNSPAHHDSFNLTLSKHESCNQALPEDLTAVGLFYALARISCPQRLKLLSLHLQIGMGPRPIREGFGGERSLTPSLYRIVMESLPKGMETKLKAVVAVHDLQPFGEHLLMQNEFGFDWENKGSRSSLSKVALLSYFVAQSVLMEVLTEIYSVTTHFLQQEQRRKDSTITERSIQNSLNIGHTRILYQTEQDHSESASLIQGLLRIITECSDNDLELVEIRGTWVAVLCRSNSCRKRNLTRATALHVRSSPRHLLNECQSLLDSKSDNCFTDISCFLLYDNRKRFLHNLYSELLHDQVKECRECEVLILQNGNLLFAVAFRNWTTLNIEAWRETVTLWIASILLAGSPWDDLGKSSSIIKEDIGAVVSENLDSHPEDTTWHLLYQTLFNDVPVVYLTQCKDKRCCEQLERNRVVGKRSSWAKRIHDLLKLGEEQVSKGKAIARCYRIETVIHLTSSFRGRHVTDEHYVKSSSKVNGKQVLTADDVLIRINELLTQLHEPPNIENLLQEGKELESFALAPSIGYELLLFFFLPLLRTNIPTEVFAQVAVSSLRGDSDNERELHTLTSLLSNFSLLDDVSYSVQRSVLKRDWPLVCQLNASSPLHHIVDIVGKSKRGVRGGNRQILKQKKPDKLGKQHGNRRQSRKREKIRVEHQRRQQLQRRILDQNVSRAKTEKDHNLPLERVTERLGNRGLHVGFKSQTKKRKQDCYEERIHYSCEDRYQGHRKRLCFGSSVVDEAGTTQYNVDLPQGSHIVCPLLNRNLDDSLHYTPLRQERNYSAKQFETHNSEVMEVQPQLKYVKQEYEGYQKQPHHFFEGSLSMEDQQQEERSDTQPFRAFEFKSTGVCEGLCFSLEPFNWRLNISTWNHVLSSEFANSEVSQYASCLERGGPSVSIEPVSQRYNRYTPFGDDDIFTFSDFDLSCTSVIAQPGNN